MAGRALGAIGEAIEIAIDKARRDQLCEALSSAGDEARGLSPGSIDQGSLSGMAGVEILCGAYYSLCDLTQKLGRLANNDAKIMKIIAKDFEVLDSSAG